MTNDPTQHEPLPRSVYTSVFLLSLAVLMVQIALNRIFSFTIWYHFAYISISLALLGFGASGSMLAAFPRLAGRSVEHALGLYGALAAASTIVMLVILGSVPLNPFEVLANGFEMAKFVLYFLAVATPFFFAGLAITIALRRAGPEVNRLYFWDLVGAGLGCALVVLAIDVLTTPRVILLVALLFAGAGLVGAGAEAASVRKANVAVAIVALLAMIPLPAALPFTPSKDKNITSWLEGGQSHFTHWGSLFRTDMVGGKDGKEATSGGYARRGISATWKQPPPKFRMIVHDGGASAIMYLTVDGLEPLQMFRHHVLTAPYVVKKDADVMIIGVGGGADVVNALVNDARSVTGIELDPVTIDLITKDFADLTTGILDHPNVELIADEGRHFARSSDREFDIVQITGVDTLAALSSGAYILSENYLYSVESYSDYFSRLRPDGIHSIGSGDFHPRGPAVRHAVRFAALSYDALRARGVAEPHKHVMIIGTKKNISPFEVLTKMKPFTIAEIRAMNEFIADNEFEAWYIPGQRLRQYPALRTVLEGDEAEREAYFENNFLNLRATTDNRPFFFSFYKWSHLFERREEIDKGHTLATGQIVLVIMLLLAVVFSIIAILLPLLRVRSGAAAMPGRWGYLCYFAALGAGFIFLEISFVQRFILFLGYPTYSLTVMLFSFLIAAGIGSYLSEYLDDDPARTLPRITGALTAIVIAYAFGLTFVFDALLGASLPVRIATTFLLCAPLGGVLGMYFPFGIRLTSAINRDFVAWAWAINGCLTVVGSVASIMLAMTFGFVSVIACAIAIYWLGAWSFIRTHAAVSRAA